MDFDLTSLPPAAVAVRIHPPAQPGGRVRLPGSKSITNRSLLMAALAHGRSVVRNALDCDDSRYMIDALRKLGVIVARSDEGSIQIDGAGGPFPERSAELYLGNAGTTLRFLTAALTLGGGHYVLDGDARMRERPIADLVRALVALGADAAAPTGCPPVTLGPRPLIGRRIDISGSISSQFVSAILMAAPLAPRRVELRVTGELVSRPYIDLTLEGMRDFGARVYVDDKRPDGLPVFEVVPARGYKGRELTVEGDASTASYFYAAAAITGSTVRVEGVGKESQQGDARCADVLAAMGCRVKKDQDAITVTGGLLKSVDWDCADIPDVVPTLAVAALFARGRTRLRGVAHLRHKESDRILSVATELRKLGAEVRELPDGLEVEGTLGPEPCPLRGAVIHSWGDHRIAMALSVAGLMVPDIIVQDPKVVSKSFPGFFDVLAEVGAGIEFLDRSGARIEPAGGIRPDRARS